MKKETKLINKIKCFLEQTNSPVRLHKFGPKTYKLWHHVFALFIKANCQFSYRRTCEFLKQLGFTVASKSTLQRYSAKLSLPFWKKLFRLSFDKVGDIISIDGTSLEKTKSSEHYIRRIDGRKPFSKGFHFSTAVSQNGRIVSLRVRKNFTHDMKDVKNLYYNLKEKPKIILMDKGYDSESLHKFFRHKKIISVAPVRKGAKRGFYRLNLKRNFPQELYNKRNIVESIFHAFKQKYGSSVNSKNITSARSEVYCKAILHNIFLIFIESWD